MRNAAFASVDAWARGAVRPLPVPWRLVGGQVKPMGGQVVMVLAAPGVGKTMFALNWAMQSSARTLYMSADTDPRTLTEQVAAWAADERRDIVRGKLADGSIRDVYMDAIRGRASNLFLDFAAGPGLGDVEDRAIALTEAWGVTPELIVLDTATDMQRAGDDYSAWKGLWIGSRELSRYLNSVIMICHHVKSGMGRDGNSAPTQDGGKYGADEFPEIVLGLHRNQHSRNSNIALTVLKNRSGMSGFKVDFEFDYEYGQVKEVVHVNN